MSPSTAQPRPRLRRGAAAAILAVMIAGIAAGAGGAVDAHSSNTVVHDDAGPEAPHIGLIGDSTLSGVRWYDDYGALDQYNFVFDADSCRRTLETSCWSREGYRPENALTAMQRLDGEWGEVLVVMSGYNDSSSVFDDAVDAVIEEARAQGIPQVMWLTFRTADVSYEEPMHRANGETYDEANRVLFHKAAEYGGYLQIADWATYSARRSGWFSYDGVHLTPSGVDGVTTFIAQQVRRLLRGETIIPDAPPWSTLEVGETGRIVTEAQRALVRAGAVVPGGVDGVYGTQTAAAVRDFQADQDLTVSGELDVPTAVALGLYDRPSFDGAPDRPPSAMNQRRSRWGPLPMSRVNERPAAMPATLHASSTITDAGGSPLGFAAPLAGVVMAAAFGVLLFVRRKRQRLTAAAHWSAGLATSASAGGATVDVADDPMPEMVTASKPVMPYDYERDDNVPVTE